MMGVGFGAAVLLGVAVASAPMIARARLVAALHEAGYPTAQVGHVALGLCSATLTNLRLDDHQTLSIDTMEVTWHWRALCAGRLETLQMTGLRVVVPAGTTGPDVRAFLPQPQPMLATGPATWPESFPVGHVSITGNVQLADHELPLVLTAQDLGAGRLWCVGALGSIATGQLTVHGTLAATAHDVTVTVTRVPLIAWAGGLVQPLPPGAVDLPETLANGRVSWLHGTATGHLDVVGVWGSLTVTGSGSAAGVTAHLVAKAVDVAHVQQASAPWLPPLPADHLDGHIEATLDGDWSPTAWSIAGRIEGDALRARTAFASVLLPHLSAEGRVSCDNDRPLVVGSLQLSAGAATLARGLPGLEVAVPTASLSCDGQHWYLSAHLAAHGANADIAGSGTLNLDHLEGRVRATDCDIQTWLTRLPSTWTASIPTALAGRANAEVRASRLGEAWGGTMSLRVTDGSAATPTWSAAAKTLDADGAFNLFPGAPPAAQAVLRVEGGSMAVPATGVAVTELVGTFPWSLGNDPGLSGDLRGNLAVHDVLVPNLRLRAQMVNNTITGRADARLLGLVDGFAEGTVAIAADDVAAQLHLTVPHAILTDPLALAAAIPAIAGWNVTGAIALDGTVSYVDAVLTPNLRVVIEDAAIEQPEMNLHAEGLRLAVRCSQLSPLKVVADHPFTVRRITHNNQLIEAAEGVLRVTGQRAEVRDLSIRWGGGTVAIPHLVADLDPTYASGTAMGDIQFNGIGLDAILEAAAPGKVSGAGRLVGHLPVTVTWPDTHVTLGVGELAADPPLGWIRIADRAMIANAVGNGGFADAALRLRVVDAVQEFAFSRLHLTTTRDAQGLLTRVQVAGRGRIGSEPLDLGGLAFNIRGVEEALAQALRLGQSPPPPADDTLDRFFGE